MIDGCRSMGARGNRSPGCTANCSRMAGWSRTRAWSRRRARARPLGATALPGRGPGPWSRSAQRLCILGGMTYLLEADDALVTVRWESGMALLSFTRTVGPALVFELHGTLDSAGAAKLS